MEEKEEKKEEDKIEKETRAFQVPCGSETYMAIVRKKQQIECLPGNYSRCGSMKRT